MDSRWDSRWSRRGQIAAKMSRPARNAPAEMISFVYGDPDAGSLPLEEMADAAAYLAEQNRTG
jgi:2-aminoadipate transaminase